jgi:endonuclease/exonuclease/phosphatase family metal-dependent hydrolase
MKNKILKFLLLFSFMQGTNLLHGQEMRLMTFNIRFNTEKDGENRWDKRKENLCSLLRFHEIEICGMQEALFGQIQDIKSLLPEYEYVGNGRDDGKEAGEFSPIFYQKDKVKLVESQTLWLSPTPERPSKGWDAALNRIVTYAKFQTRKGNKVFYVFNTHFDHIGETARRESAKLVIELVKKIAKDTPAIIMGDFNSTPQDEPCQILNVGLINTLSVSETPHFGPKDTFNGFENKERENSEIDHIFLNTKKIRVKKHATITQTWAGRFASDHHPVMVVIQL